MKKTFLWRMCAVICAAALTMPWGIAYAEEPASDPNNSAVLNAESSDSASDVSSTSSLSVADDSHESIPADSDHVSDAASAEMDASHEDTSSTDVADTSAKPRMRRALSAAPTSGIVAGDFASLKAAIENPDRETELVIPGGTYKFSDTVSVSKDLILKNAAGEKVVFELGNPNTNSSNLGSSMINVTEGVLTLDADVNENLVFDGLGGLGDFNHTTPPAYSDIPDPSTFVTNSGVFITFNSATSGVINHATFKNAANSGALTGALFLKPSSTLTMNDGEISHNFLDHIETAANNEYMSNPNTISARSAAIGIYGGTFIMNGGSIVDNLSVLAQGGAIGSTGGVVNGSVVRAKIELNGGTISQNTSVNPIDWYAPSAAGAIMLGVNSDMVINDGTFSDNYTNGPGGFVHADWGTSLTINGGTFRNNKADQAGGVVSAYDRFMVYDASNSENYSGELNAYNVSDINVWYNTYHLGTKLTVNDGTFDSNEAYMGGAVYVAADKSEINGGTFTNNQANRFGGAIYLASQPYTMKIRNAYVSGNTATENSITTGGNLYPDMPTNIFHPGSGGGIWYCPTGNGDINVSNGLAVFDNTAGIEGNDFTSMNKESDTYKVSVANRALGGGYVAWYNDTMDKRYAEGDPELDPIVDESEDVMIRSNISDRSKASAKTIATTLFIGNSAKRGGAIASNGRIDFGDANLTFNLEVVKNWNELIAEKSEVTVELYIVKTEGGEEQEFFSDEVVLNEENGYRATFKDLPLENNGKTTYRIKEAGDAYDVSYTTKLADGAETAGNTFNTADVIHGDTVVVTATNNPLYNVTYEFKSLTPGKELPAEVLNQLPSNQVKQKKGSTIAPEIPAQPTVREGNGTWKFIEWTPVKETIVDHDLHFVGTWVYTEDTVVDPKDPDPTPDPSPTPDPDPTPEPDSNPTPEPGNEPDSEPKVTPQPSEVPNTGEAPYALGAGVVLGISALGALVALRKRSA